MNPFEELRADVVEAIAAAGAAGELPAGLPLERLTVEPPRDSGHGDAATNAAMVLAKPAGKPPLAIAEIVARRLSRLDKVAAVEVAKPGFVNLRLTDAFWQRQVTTALAAGPAYGRADLGQGRLVNVEFCSANPTGPLHVGHGRGTVFGDALASLLQAMGYRVVREYYINDAGVQIDRLARSVRHRYLEALRAAPAEPPEGWYPGDYLAPLGRALAEQDGDRWCHATEEDWLPVFRARAVSAMMAQIRADLAALGVAYDVFTSEAALIADGRLRQALDRLQAAGLLYTGTLPPPKGRADDDWEPVPLLLFRASAFGDDVDRPVQNSRREWTYFAADLAYHLDKVERGAEELIDVWGADHGGYVKRMQAAVRALSRDRARLDVKLCQLVNLLDGGQPLKMSKRAGRIVTLRDVVDEVGRDVVRFIMLTRKNDAPLDFDLQRVVEQSRDNPVFYVQYAHARIRSVQRNALEMGLDPAPAALLDAPVESLVDPAELALVKQIAQLPRTLEAATASHEPHRIAFYLYDLAGSFHVLWNRGKESPELRFLRSDTPDLTRARLALLAATQIALTAGLDIMGVVPVEEMT